MAISYAIHLKSGTRCDLRFESDEVSAADVWALSASTSGEIGQHLWVDKESVAAVEILHGKG